MVIYICVSLLWISREDSHRPKYTANILTLSEKKRFKNRQKGQPEKSFSNVYIVGTICFGKCFLFHLIAGKHSF